jgi:uncharacterized protein (DUF2164 family)
VPALAEIKMEPLLAVEPASDPLLHLGMGEGLGWGWPGKGAVVINRHHPFPCAPSRGKGDPLPMPKITFDKDTRAKLVGGLSRLSADELDLDVKGFDAEFLLDFVSERLGPYYYNQGLHDASALFAKKIESITDAVYELEMPTKGF